MLSGYPQSTAILEPIGGMGLPRSLNEVPFRLRGISGEQNGKRHDGACSIKEPVL
jgi:hypothetical protein